MKRRISKRIIAIGMSLCVAFSIMPLSVSAEAETAAPAVKQNNLWVSTGKTFVNRIYTVGLTTCGSALVRIAGATESEGFQKVASFVNKWICGGNNTGQTLAEIQALCNEILNEVKIVDQHLKEYDAEIENTLQKIQYTEAKNELNQQWSKDIDVYETAGNVGNTLSAYEDYMKAAQLYMDGKTDMNAVEKSKQKLYDNFIEVYKAAGNSFENPTDATVTTDNSSVQFHGGKAKYALYPVWLLNTTWNGNKYTFAMNGQTGKFVGDLPVDKGAAARWTVMLAAVFSVVTYGAAWLLHLIGLF